MWQVVVRTRELGRAAVKSSVVPGSQVSTPERAIRLAKISAERGAIMHKVVPPLPIQLAENVFQYDTPFGKKFTYQAQPISWKV